MGGNTKEHRKNCLKKQLERHMIKAGILFGLLSGAAFLLGNRADYFFSVYTVADTKDGAKDGQFPYIFRTKVCKAFSGGFFRRNRKRWHFGGRFSNAGGIC